MFRLAAFEVLLLLILVAPVSVAFASSNAPQVVSGTDTIPVSLTAGNSVYSISYSYPASADVGSNLTVAIGLGVVSFTGDKLYVSSYSLSALISFPSGKTVSDSISVSNSSAFIYEGGTAAPTSIVLPLTAENSGLAPGQSTLVNVTVGFTDEVWYEPPVGNYYPEYGSVVVGQAVVTNPASPPIWQPIALIGSGAILLSAGLFLKRSSRRGTTASSQLPDGK